MRWLCAALLALATGGAQAAPVPKHVFPRSADPVVPGLLVSWEGNPTIWIVKRIEGEMASIQCADGTGDLYPCPVAEIRKLRHHQYVPGS